MLSTNSHRTVNYLSNARVGKRGRHDYKLKKNKFRAERAGGGRRDCHPTSGTAGWLTRRLTTWLTKKINKNRYIDHLSTGQLKISIDHEQVVQVKEVVIKTSLCTTLSSLYRNSLTWLTNSQFEAAR